mgnify:FL=1
MLFRSLIRIETKLTHLSNFLQCPHVSFEGKPVPDLTEADMAKALIRIESKLQGVMLHLGLNPYERVQK